MELKLLTTRFTNDKWIKRSQTLKNGNNKLNIAESNDDVDNDQLIRDKINM